VTNNTNTISTIFDNRTWGFTALHVNLVVKAAASGVSSTGRVFVSLLGSDILSFAGSNPVTLNAKEFTVNQANTTYNLYCVFTDLPPAWAIRIDNLTGANISFSKTAWTGSRLQEVDTDAFFHNASGGFDQEGVADYPFYIVSMSGGFQTSGHLPYSTVMIGAAKFTGVAPAAVQSAYSAEMTGKLFTFVGKAGGPSANP
jgi:hypothetical protein